MLLRQGEVDAGIVTGEGEGLSGWELPASMQDTTGVVYATSFPALDTAIAEVSRHLLHLYLRGTTRLNSSHPLDSVLRATSSVGRPVLRAKSAA